MLYIPKVKLNINYCDAMLIINVIEFEPSPYESPRPNSSERVDDLTLMSNNGHVYQPTGDTIPSTDNDYRTGQCRYQVQFFPTEVQHNNTIAEENALDHSPESKIKHSPTNSKEDLELSQVYDAVSPKPFVERGATAGMVYDQLTHSGHHGKQSLPTYLGGAPEYSSLSVWQDSPHNKALGESMPVYDAPDVKPVKGRKSYRAMTLPSHKISSCSCPPLPLSKLESRDILDLEHTYAILEQDQSTHDIQVENNRDSEVHTHAILERCQSQLSAACVQTGSTEVDHTYAILEQDQGEGLLSSEGDTCEADDNMEHTYAILEQDHTEGLLSNESDTRDADMEHTYAILEQELPRTLKLAEQEYHTLEETANFRTYTSHDLHSQESRPDQRKLSSSKPRDANFELVQIYNKVTSKPPNAREMDAALTEQRSHQACRKKQSLPSYLGARRTGHSATDVGNTPDLKTKKQRKKKQGNERPSNSEAAMGAAASHHKISTTSCPPVSLFTESEGANVARCNTMDGQYTPGGASHV